MTQQSASSPEQARLRVLMMDDHELIRVAIRHLLERHPWIEIVGEVATNEDGMLQCRIRKVDLVVLHVKYPGVDELQLLQRLRRDCPRTRVLIITSYENPTYLVDLMRAGASGFLLRDATWDMLLRAIHRIAHGESALEGDVAKRVLEHLADAPVEALPLAIGTITPREHEIIQLITAGLTNNEIATRLGISLGTTKNYVGNVLSKMGARTRLELAARAVDLGYAVAPGAESSNELAVGTHPTEQE